MYVLVSAGQCDSQDLVNMSGSRMVQRLAAGIHKWVGVMHLHLFCAEGKGTKDG